MGESRGKADDRPDGVDCRTAHWISSQLMSYDSETTIMILAGISKEKKKERSIWMEQAGETEAIAAAGGGDAGRYSWAGSR